MGVSNTKQKFLGNPLIFAYMPFDIKDIDDIMSRGFNLVKKTEVIRCSFIPNWNSFILKSGAIVISTPHCESGMNGMLMKIANDLNGNLYNNVIISTFEPFIIIKRKNELSPDSISIVNSFENLVKCGKDNYEKLLDINDKFKDYFGIVGKYQKDINILFERKGCSPNEVVHYSKKMKKYINQLKLAYDYMNKMNIDMEEIKQVLIDYEEHCKNEKTMMKFEKIGKDAREKGIKLPTKIMYKYSPEKKLKNYEDFYDRVSDFSNIEKNAKALLFKINTSKMINKDNNNIEDYKNIEVPFNDNKKESKKQNVIDESNKENVSLNKKNDDSSEIINPLDEDEEPFSHEELKQITNELDNNLSSQDNSILYNYTLIKTITASPDSSVSVTAIIIPTSINMIICGLSNGSIVFIKNDSDSIYKTLNTHTNKSVSVLLYLEKEGKLISGGKDGTLYKHILEKEESRIIGEEESIDSIVDLCNEKEVLVSSNINILCYDYKEEVKTYSFIAHNGIINQMKYNPSKDILLTCSNDKLIKIWKLDQKECIGELKGVNSEIVSICSVTYNDEVILVSVCKDGLITFWNLNDKTKTKFIKYDFSPVILLDVGGPKNVCLINEEGIIDILDVDNISIKYEYKSVPLSTCGYCQNNHLFIGKNNSTIEVFEYK